MRRAVIAPPTRHARRYSCSRSARPVHSFGARMIGGRQNRPVLYALSKSSPRSLREQAQHEVYDRPDHDFRIVRYRGSHHRPSLPMHKHCRTAPYTRAAAAEAIALKSSSGYHSPRLICERATFFKNFFVAARCVLSTHMYRGDN